MAYFSGALAVSFREGKWYIWGNLAWVQARNNTKLGGLGSVISWLWWWQNIEMSQTSCWKLTFGTLSFCNIYMESKTHQIGIWNKQLVKPACLVFHVLTVLSFMLIFTPTWRNDSVWQTLNKMFQMLWNYQLEKSWPTIIAISLSHGANVRAFGKEIHCV